jgi:Uma2 family endonuclease
LLDCERQRDYFAGMNRPYVPDAAVPIPVAVTSAAEGLPRRAFTVAELYRMTEAGILQEDERLELIGGEVVPMSPKGNHHEVTKVALNLYWARRLPEDLVFATETTFHLDEFNYLEPDFVFYPKAGSWKGLNPQTAKLVVEIADSGLRYDMGRKANLYAAFGIVELWVIDAVRLETRIHREPTSTGYRNIADVGPAQRLVPALIPDLAVTLSELDIR